MMFRTGRHLGRTIYVQLGDGPERGRDVELGMVDTPELGSLICTALNAYAASGDLQWQDTAATVRKFLHWRRLRS